MARRSRKGSAGAFFGGTFFGFIMCLALIAGLGCFVYFKVSPNWINKTFKTNIDLGSDELNKKTVKGFVSSVMNITDNMDSYTIENLNDDFGIKIDDNLFGIDITDLKEVPMKELSVAIENKFATISAEELRNVKGMNLQAQMGNILDKENTYYFNPIDKKLYKQFNGSSYSQLVDFDYEVNNNYTRITTKGYTVIISNGEVKIPLWYLPLTSALSDFTKNMGNQTTLKDLELSYGVTLPNFLKNVDKENTTVNQLESVVMSVTVGEILNLNIKYDQTSEEYYDDINKNNVKDSGEEIAYVLKSIAETKVEDLDSLINDFKFSQIFTEEERSSGLLSLITTDPTIAEIPETIENVVSETSIEDLIDEGIITVKSSDMTKLSITVDHDNNSSTPKIALISMTIDEFIDYCLDLVPNF